MRKLIGTALMGGLLLAASFAMAQRPGAGRRPAAKSEGGDDLAERMLAYDKDGDGKLTRAEVTDERLTRLFDRADADKDGVVTKAELTALAAQQPSVGRGGFGGPGGGPGGPMMGPPRPGEVLPPMLQQRLNLTASQKAEVEALQKDVDARLAKILTSEQSAQLKEMRRRGPGGFGGPGGPGGRRPGGPGGPGGFGGPGGPPPDGLPRD